MEFIRKSNDTAKFLESQSDKHPEASDLKRKYRELNKYKILCERRILEICPDHPIPVQESHLGTSYKQDIELQIARQKIAKLERQLQNFAEMKLVNPKSSVEQNFLEVLREKEYLEETLRAEMLSCEEQRAYIEILKQSFEDFEERRRNSDQGFSESKLQNVDVRRENANLKSIIKDLQSQIEKNKKFLQDKDEENKKIFKQNKEIGANLQELEEKVKRLEEEILQLEEEKASLLEYIDDHSQKEQEMENEMNDLVKLFEEMKESHSETMRKFHEETVKSNKFEEEIKRIQNDLEQSMKLGREMQNSNEMLKEQLSQVKTAQKKVKSEKQDLEIKFESLLANVTTLSETLKESQEEIDYYQESLQKIQKNLTDKESNIDKLKTEVFEKNQEISALKSVNSMLEKEKSFKVEEKSEVLKDFEKEKQKFSGVAKKLSAQEEQIKDLEKKLTEKIFVEKGLNEEISILKQSEKEIQKIKLENTDLQKREKLLNNQIQELSQTHKAIVQEHETQLKQIQQLNEEKIQLTTELEEFDKIVIENKTLHDLLDEEKNSVNDYKFVMSSDRSLIENKLKSSERSEQKSTEYIEYLQNHLKEEEELIVSLREELRDTKFQLDNQEILFLGFKDRLYSCIQTILSVLPLHQPDLSSYFSILSNSLKENIIKLKLNQNPDLIDICNFSIIASENLKFLLEINLSLQDELNNKNYEISLNINRIEALSNELESNCNNFSMVSRQIENSQKENLALRAEFQALSQENYDLKFSLEKNFLNLKNLKTSSDELEHTIKVLEFENKSLKSDKCELQNLLNTCKGGMIKENLYEGSELEMLERNRLDLQYQLLKFQSDPRSRDGIMFKELGNRLNLCERQIKNYYNSFTPSSKSRTDTPLRLNTFKYPETVTVSNRLRGDLSHSKRDRSVYN